MVKRNKWSGSSRLLEYSDLLSFIYSQTIWNDFYLLQLLLTFFEHAMSLVGYAYLQMFLYHPLTKVKSPKSFRHLVILGMSIVTHTIYIMASVATNYWLRQTCRQGDWFL